MALDLTDAELDELDDLLAQTPAPLEALDLVMLDGYLCGVLVQPRLVPVEEWLPPVFDLEGRPLPADVDTTWHARCAELILRRHAGLTRDLAEDGWFDPILHEAGDAEAEAEASPEAREVLAGLPTHSRPLFAWVAGFQYAGTVFPGLSELEGDDALDALDRVFRHLPAEDGEDVRAQKALDQALPLRSVDEAVEDLVSAVATLWELTADDRYRVEPVRRVEPKVGRNDPCPCGSGKKFKHCHGA